MVPEQPVLVFHCFHSRRGTHSDPNFSTLTRTCSTVLLCHHMTDGALVKNTLSILTGMDFALWWVIPCWVYVRSIVRSAATFCELKPGCVFHPGVVGSGGCWHLAAENVISGHFMLMMFWFWCEVEPRRLKMYNYLHSWLIYQLFPWLLNLLFGLQNVWKKLSLNPKTFCHTTSPKSKTISCLSSRFGLQCVF